MARSGARAAAMQLIYERLMGGSGQDTLGVLIDFTPEEEDSRYINTVVEGVAEHVASKGKKLHPRTLETIAWLKASF